MTLTALAILCALGASLTRVEGVRGVVPHHVPRYAEGVMCRLRDAAPGSANVAIGRDRVNDDYCDCADGADEPGTSACSGGSFWCVNKGFVGKRISSSWVDDGFCDCCDGSDEGEGVCRDRCAEMGEDARKRAEEAAERIMTGVRMREAYAKEGAAKAKADAKELKKLERELKEVQNEIRTAESRAEFLRGRKDYEAKIQERESAGAEPAERNELMDAGARDDFADDANEIENDETEPVSMDEAEPDYGDDVVEDVEDSEIADNAHNVEDIEDDLGVEGDGLSANEEAEQVKEEDGDEEAEQVKEEDSDANVDNEQINETVKGEVDVDALCAELDSSVGTNPMMKKIAFAKMYMFAKLRRVLPKVFPSSSGSAVGDIDECVRRADSAKWDLNSKKRTLDEKIKTLKEKKDMDYGSDGALRKLHGECIKKKITQYEFEHCPFDVVRQYEHGSMIAKLGKFSRWDSGTDGGEGRAMMYKNGDQCWNGPSRSIRVVLECGDVDSILSVDEPNRCTYVMKFQTPAACEKSAADAVLTNIDYGKAGADVKEEL